MDNPAAATTIFFGGLVRYRQELFSLLFDNCNSFANSTLSFVSLFSFVWVIFPTILLAIYTYLSENPEFDHLRDKEDDTPERFFPNYNHTGLTKFLVDRAIMLVLLYLYLATKGMLHPAWDIVYISEMLHTLPSKYELLSQLAITLFTADTIIYWAHRAFHTRKFYWIHKMHHEVVHTRATLGAHMSTAEILIISLPTVILPPLLLNMHLFTACIWWMFIQMHDFYQHSGYNVSLTILPGNTSKFHYDHHAKNIGNFAFYLPFWDWVCGTGIKL